MSIVGDLMPFFAMLIVQFGYAGLNITSKLALDSGMKPLVLVAYRQMFATLATIPFAYFFEWKTRPKITLPILFLVFLCSITGATGNQVLYFLGLENSTPTIGCALVNIIPAFTFVLAVIFRQESVAIKTKSGQAKVLGTIICVGGAMLLSLYHGNKIGIPNSSIHWKYGEQMSEENSRNKSNLIVGSIALFASSISWAMWIIIQTQLSKKFAAPYTNTALMCFIGSIECSAIGLIVERKLSAWRLNVTIRLVSAIYSGIVCSALGFCLTSWSIQRKGPLYVSVFSPLSLVIVAILSWALLHEKLVIGTAIGSVLIVTGLYAVLWGKDKEQKLKNVIKETEVIKEAESGDLEQQQQLCAHSNGNIHHVEG